MTQNIHLLVNDFLQEYSTFTISLTNERCSSNQTYKIYSIMFRLGIGIGSGALFLGLIGTITSMFNLLFLVFPLLVICQMMLYFGYRKTNEIFSEYKERAEQEILEKAFLRWAYYNLGKDAPEIIQELIDIIVEIKDGDDVQYSPDYFDTSIPSVEDLNKLIASEEEDLEAE